MIKFHTILLKQNLHQLQQSMQEEKGYLPHKTPNILVTGTPGTGKTTFCQLINQSLNFQYLPIGQLIKQNKLYDQWDDQLDVPIFHDDMLLEFIQKNYHPGNGGIIVDFHSPLVFPPEWFDLVVVMRCNNQVLYKRLEQRKYAEKKIQQNIECEIFEEIKLDVEQHFGDRPQCVLEFRNQKQEDMQACIDSSIEWLINYKQKLEGMNQ